MERGRRAPVDSKSKRATLEREKENEWFTRGGEGVIESHWTFPYGQGKLFVLLTILDKVVHWSMIHNISEM